MAFYLLNGWGWTMPQPKKGTIRYEDLSAKEFTEKLEKGECISCIGNPALARILKIPYNPSWINLKDGDTAVVVNIQGGKLPFSAKELPLDVSLKFTKVEIEGEAL